MKTTILEHIENPNPELVEKVKEFQNRKEQVLKELEKEMNDKGKLQNNFTTVEQSKRLLEIGLPTNSADCYFTESGKIEIKNTAFDILYTPCWSVGRLIEICDICILAGGGKKGEFCFDRNNLNKTYVQDMVDTIEGMLKLKLFDFSKLEE